MSYLRALYALRDRFRWLLAQPHVDYRDIWQLFLDNPWYRYELHMNSVYVLKHAPSVHCFVSDIEEDARELLGSDLQRRPDLGIDWARAEKGFRAWLHSVVLQQCMRALEAGWKRWLEQLPQVPLPVDDWLPNEIFRMDLEQLLAKLEPELREVLELHLAKFTIQEIAERKGLTFCQARRLIKRARCDFREILRNYESDRPL